MIDFGDEGEIIEDAEPDPAITEDTADTLFGDFSVLSPGVQIVLEGRPVSAPAR